ncbi:UNVERIFIED_CONTAM: Beta-1,2-xylosyltransferase XYXT1 [Sesamum radiatum]|uniref:Beta-1,2-xylosyltransferase XYXT1 n=1 Tax=Sesamum radiatum TaxID=300843 RepID=A0AAW2LNH9_SESRA
MYSIMSSSSWNSRMQKSGSSLISGTAAVIFFLTVSLLFADHFGLNVIPFDKWREYLSTPQINFCSREIRKILQEQEPVSRLVRGEDLKKLEATGFACDRAEHSFVCVANRSVIIDTTTNITVYVPTNQTVQEETSVRPYARQEDNLQYVTPVKILQRNSTSRVCQYNHQIPAVVFSTAFIGNLFHEFDDLIIPLFITTRHFESRVLLIMEDHNPWFLSKYSKIISRLSGYQVMNPAANRSIHCFPGSVVGLKYHNNLFLNCSDIPGGYSMSDFRQFLVETYDLKFWHVSQIRNPTLILVSREKTRRFLNEDEIVRMMQEVGFKRFGGSSWGRPYERAVLAYWSCDGASGAAGAGMGIGHVFWRPDGDDGPALPEVQDHAGESSLVEFYGRNHPVIMDPASVFAEGYRVARAVYVDQQDVRVDVGKFRETIVLALQLVGSSCSGSAGDE